jgi:photosystem II stability/assembly factor-like uncharacterized protein
VLALLVGAGVFLALHHGGGGGTSGHAGAGPGPGSVPPSRTREKQQIVRVAVRHTIGAAGLFAAGTGWAMNGLALYWTQDDGAHWRVITPPDVLHLGDPIARIVDLDFVDHEHGWLTAEIRAADGSRQMAVERTTNGGRTWQSATVPAVHLSLLGARQGFALTGIQPRPRLYATHDGGASWKLVATAPFTGRFVFLNPRDGWAVSDPSRMTGPSYNLPVGGGVLYRTTDGGRQWQRVQLPAASGFAGESMTVGIPRFFGSRDGVVPVRFRDRLTGSQHVVVYVTNNGGDSWSGRPAPSDADLRRYTWGFPEAVPFSAANATDWVLFVGPRLYATADAGRSWSTVHPAYAPNAPRVWDVDFASRTSGWAIFAAGQGSVLVRTRNGGKDWSPLAPH